MKNKKVILIVLDGVGTGFAPDAEKFGDVGSDTLGHVFEKHPNIKLDNMKKLGLFNMRNEFNNDNYDLPNELIGSFGRCTEQSIGKDTTIGHWEMAGIITSNPFPTYPNGFPEDILADFTKATGYEILGNKVASGTEIIKELGQKHIDTKKIIVYTSADSVFQIAAHEDVVPINKLYEVCEKARGLLKDEHSLARVIARPFAGEYPNFYRTADRKDFSLSPSADTMLNVIDEAGMESVGVGKIEDIFNKSGVNRAIHSHGNAECLPATILEVEKNYTGLLFVNLVDFDMNYGHRNDIDGFASALEKADEYIGKYIEFMPPCDLMIITADHGCDPGFKGTDHTREYVPLLVYSKSFSGNVNLGTRKTYADIAATCLDYLELDVTRVAGKSFLKKL